MWSSPSCEVVTGRCPCVPAAGHRWPSVSPGGKQGEPWQALVTSCLQKCSSDPLCTPVKHSSQLCSSWPRAGGWLMGTAASLALGMKERFLLSSLPLRLPLPLFLLLPFFFFFLSPFSSSPFFLLFSPLFCLSVFLSLPSSSLSSCREFLCLPPSSAVAAQFWLEEAKQGSAAVVLLYFMFLSMMPGTHFPEALKILLQSASGVKC